VCETDISKVAQCRKVVRFLKLFYICLPLCERGLITHQTGVFAKAAHDLGAPIGLRAGGLVVA
jgi:hypothetical protein